MADVKWIKIVTDIFDDEKILLIESLPEADSVIVIWFKLLCLAGKQNNSGVFTINDKIPYTEEMFATIFRRPLNTVRLALNAFEQYGMIERIDGVVTIPNWGKHQSLEQIEARRKYNREYQRMYYAKQKQLAESSKCLENGLENGLYNDLSKTNLNGIDKNKNKKKDKIKKDIFADFAANDGELLQALREFDEMRTKIKHPLTDPAKERIVAKLKSDFPREQWIAVLNQSVDHSWQGIFPLKQDMNKPAACKPSSPEEISEKIERMKRVAEHL